MWIIAKKKWIFDQPNRPPGCDGGMVFKELMRVDEGGVGHVEDGLKALWRDTGFCMGQAGEWLKLEIGIQGGGG